MRRVGARQPCRVDAVAAACWEVVQSPAAIRATTAHAVEKENSMKKLMTVLALTLAAASMTVQAADEKKPTAQQNKMTECNKDAGDKQLKGDERKAFMKTCLSAKKASQQDKMKTCNKDAGDKQLKGDERKKFMSECLKA
jgi:hypothetical protein